VIRELDNPKLPKVSGIKLLSRLGLKANPGGIVGFAWLFSTTKFPLSLFQMSTYPTFGQGLTSPATMAYLKAAPTYHMSSLALGMPSHGLESLQSHYSHGGKAALFQ